MILNFEKLRVTPIIHELITRIYQVSSGFPFSERNGLQSQLRRSMTSVLLNVAEGSARSSRKDYARFIRIAIASLVETKACLDIVKSLKYVDAEQHFVLDGECRSLYISLVSLRNSISSIASA
ncbi:MAG: four helix bundle protein [Patescibacteria group bacterium]